MKLTKADELLQKIMEEYGTADIALVRHGKWIVKWWDDDGDARDLACSVCGFSHVYFYDMPTNYCPNCGARMQEGTVDVDG